MEKKTQRVMLKLSGEIFCGADGRMFESSFMENIVQEMREIRKRGCHLAITLGGGNIWRYRDFVDLPLERSDSDFLGMLATLMNAVVLRGAFLKENISAVAFSRIDAHQVLPCYNRETARNHFESGDIVILAGGTGNPYFTTDSAAALNALELGCENFFKATKVDYVYDKDPMKHRDAKAFHSLSFSDILKKQLKVMDLTAISLCEEAHLPIRVFNVLKKGNLLKACNGDRIGTLIS